MYEPSAPPSQMLMFGLSADDLVRDVEVWPDNWPAFRLFNALSTQWRMGASGPTGLDYTSIRDVARFIGIKKKQIAEIFPDLQVMEVEAIAVMAEARETSP
ncbi:DUF1799 domain-containing protein [Pseudomonas mediterranea]|uniref:DUF1799 domain-containing protein n=1 Tax=Pseudomonas mediterranea TaxID=183795 RepID=A0AAX2DEC8_9PSED|nr:DUF1799 domain-containing protein [Pseudomonas mediterranea]KGU87198.1 phage protein [Pseudomonas mediterranea CFBP 5447]SDU61540.1 Phage related hypothetical protein [Pseudomonas mediterranea]